MAQSLLQVALFLFLIALANVLKRTGLFSEREGATLSKITLNITLPAAIVASFNTFKLDYSLLVLILYGILANVVLMVFSYLSMRKESNGLKGYALLCGSTYNVGNFSFPFVQALYGPPALVAASLFDLGNALMTTGFTYSLASTTAGGTKPNTKDLLTKLFTSAPFITYLIMISLSFANLTLPRFFQDWMQTIGKANPIIAMLMIGFMLDIRFQKGWIKKSFVLLIIRYGLATVFAYFIIKHTQFSQVIRFTLALAVFSPISTSSVAFTEKISDQGKLASFTSSLSVMTSALCYVVLTPLLS
ncbi:AEC family transporter [uncultured Sphaerochaeta sp.]|uniref:AEC family transporter n=1 Tax=uncultured Sphaerochaeta sp. TaxID=886478 RepID=UPI0026386093|nr:AEC family transporter [uncultured Sphaerochaeta sp.]